MRVVVEELAVVEQQLEALLDRQSSLLDQKTRLETAIREAGKRPSAAQNKDWEHENFEWSERLNVARQEVFQVPSFRPLQLSAMNATLSGYDCLLVMPTGGGKSLCFQLPAVTSDGISLVVSPLVSLMEDQLMALRDLGVNAALLNAASPKDEVNRVHAAMTDKRSDLRLLYVTPEKLAKSKRFMNKLEKMHEAGRFCRLVIDEVHCCSQWGNDFRPDYKFLGVMRRQFPGVPIIGLTATAGSSVVTDVKKILGISDCLLFRASFNRTNLFYEVRRKPATMKDTMDDMQKLIETRFPQQSGIVYCFSRKDTEDVTRELQLRGIRAGCYHADMDAQHRSKVHHAWAKNDIQVVVATVAFGMGIDKPDVRFVLHHSMSKSMENYYQESGRAGRDNAKAHCILYISFTDVFRQSTMVFTEQTGLDKLYAMVTYAYDVTKCRRAIIARHFGERWDSTQCNNMCDHCQVGTKGARHNVAALFRDVICLIEHAQASKQRVTALKVLEAWSGKGPTALRVKSVQPPKLPRIECERAMAFMLLHGYLREDFHFTPYSTISYLLPGARASLLQSGDHEVLMERPARGVVSATAMSSPSLGHSKASNPSTDSNRPAKGANSHTLSPGAAPTKPRPDLANPRLQSSKTRTDQKSKTGGSKSKKATKSESDDSKSTNNHSKSTPSSTITDHKGVRKRKPLVTWSDSEDSELDFLVEKSSAKKARTKPANPSPRQPSGESEDCIILDDT